MSSINEAGRDTDTGLIMDLIMDVNNTASTIAAPIAAEQQPVEASSLGAEVCSQVVKYDTFHPFPRLPAGNSY